MKKYLLAIAIAFGALLGLSSVQAAPLSSASAALQNHVTKGDAVQKVWHCRYWSGGWGCGGYRWGWRRWGWRRWRRW